MRISRWGPVAVIAVLATIGFAGTAWAGVVTANHAGPFDFCDTEYGDNFTDVRRGAQINAGPDLGGTGHCAVNFTGSTGSAGDTWITRYDPAVGSDEFTGWNGLCMKADVLISRFDNAKGAGLVALLQTDPGDKGLFLLLIDNGNTDRLTLNTIDPNNGKIVQLATVALGSGIVEDAWYRLHLRLVASGWSDSLFVQGQVRSHTDPADADSSVDGVVGTNLVFSGTLSAHGLNAKGFVGMAAWAKLAVVDSSITNFEAADNCD